jgi:hypothetical protein
LIWLGYHPKGATTAAPKADVIDELCTQNEGTKAVLEIKVKRLQQQN